MNILKYFSPKERKFYGMFINVADNLVVASNEFNKLMIATTSEERKIIGLNIKSFERKGDDLTNEIMEELHKTFITPFDREDIATLASTLDDVLDLIYGVSGKIEYYHFNNISTYMVEMVKQIQLGCVQIQVAINGLEKMGKEDKILKACNELRKIESRVDVIFHEAISSLFDNEKDSIELIKQKEVLQNIEKVANKIEDVSKVVKTILIKYA
jgi:predicted phosphate transport protein (TIGR00153 family)